MFAAVGGSQDVEVKPRGRRQDKAEPLCPGYETERHRRPEKVFGGREKAGQGQERRFVGQREGC